MEPNQLFSFLTSVARTESEWPDSNDQVGEISRALEVRKDLLLDGAEEIVERFNDYVS